MTRPRSATVLADEPGFYHCISKCVRGAWLCGTDSGTGISYEHRRDWVERRLLHLADSFAVGLYAWAVMSNHTHVVLHVDPNLPRAWTPEEVADRWSRLHRGLFDNKTESSNQARSRRRQAILESPRRTEEIRARLGSLSWFMRFLNEAIAVAANREDACTGRFWEGRFRCKALRDEGAVLGCMVYVDLNPIRAGITQQVEDCEFTSLAARLSEGAADGTTEQNSPHLRAVSGFDTPQFPRITLPEYMDLVEWSVRLRKHRTPNQSRPTPPGHLIALQIDPVRWRRIVERMGSVFGAAVGSPRALRLFARRTGRHWVKGTNQ